ncbi:DMT family transporter [Thioalkalivibrio sp. XN279]|uniref:DMT family transporter n=1 Tax=Thioalkalivibrio sp. XN279 TaxID=2714953 RepID=UPI00140D5B86|nr:DMT family transporter [Thioalkalivibrio sp. XN279]NHA13958.1 DMT family transporter [Thioalkalivibrio sp. XN279]
MPLGNEQRAVLFGLGAVLLWSTVATAFKLSLQYLSPVQLLAWASVVSLLTLGVLLVATGRLAGVLRGSRRDYLRSLALGLINPLCYYLVLFEAYDRLPAQEAQPLNYTWAFTLALLAVPLLGHRLTRADVLGGVVAYAGVWVIATRGEVFGLAFASPAGVALALGSTVLWALYWIYSTRDKRDPLVALFCNFALGLPFVLLACALTDGLAVPDWRGLAGAAWVGVFEMGLAFALWLSALRLTRNTARISNLIFLSPFLSLFFIRAFVGETILPSTWLGLALIVTGLAAQQWLRPRPR